MPTAYLGEQLVHWTVQGEARVLYVHGVPNSGAMWAPFLARTGGVAVDLPGFGRSGKRADGDFSFEALGRFVGDFLDHLGWEEARLCLHEWGAVGLLAAQDRPERIERLALLDAVPLLPGFRWPWLARQWRRRGIGELAMGSLGRRVWRRLGVDEADLDDVVSAFDIGTQRSMLALYRSAPEAALERAGAELARIDCPALVAWGAEDRVVDARFAQAYAAALGGPVTVDVVAGAGHWPWHDDPALVARVADFLVG